MRRAVLLGLALVAAGCGGEGPTASPPPPPTTTTAALVAPAPAPAEPAVPTTTAPALATALELEVAIRDALVPFTDVPGAAVAVVRDGEVVASVGVGIDPATDVPITSATRFQVGSISKPVAAVTAASLVDDAILSWEADIHDALTSYTIPTDFAEPPTLAQLLSHTSGATVDGFLGYGPEAELPTVPEVLAGDGNSDAVVILTQPGSWAYSGGGYTAVQQAMVDATGASFADLARARVLEPMGMTRSSYDQPLSPEDFDDDTSVGSIGGEPFGPMVHPELAAAGLWSTADDLAAFLLGFQAALDGRSDLITADTAALMVTPVSGGPGVVVGRGWFVDFADPVAWFWHSGRNVGYSAELIGSVDGRHGVVVLTNALDAAVAIDAVVRTVSELEGWEGLPH